MKTYLTIEKEDLINIINQAKSSEEMLDKFIEDSIKRFEFEFDELDEDAKENAIKKLWNINIDYTWWDCTCNDAEEIGLKIEEFDLDKAQSIGGKLMRDLDSVCGKILATHGDMTETYKLAKEYIEKSAAIPDDDDYDDNYNKLKSDFEAELLDCYFDILRKEEEYLQSKEAIIETIKANEYKFTKDGELC